MTKKPTEILRGLNVARNGGGDGAGVELGVSEQRIVEIVGAGRKVLYLGLPTLPLIRALQKRACDVVLVVPAGSDAAGTLSVFCEQVISRPIGAAGLVAELPEGEFDAVVLDGEAATAGALSELLPAVEHAIGPRAVVIGCPVPGAPASGPDSGAAVLEAARFVTVRGDEPRSAGAMAEDLLAGGRPDTPARPVFAAFRVPEDELSLINSRLQALARAAERADAGAKLERHLQAAEETRMKLEHERDAAEEHIRALEQARRKLESERDIAQAEAAALRHSNKRLADRDEQLRTLLLDAHEQLLQRDEELAVAIAQSLPGSGGHLGYRRLIARVRALVDELVPEGAVVAVASKGDDELLELGDRTGWHLPQSDDGAYLGHHPADGRHAVDQVEWLRERGADFLVVPGSTWWWLEHYAELREHLEKHYETIAREERVCLIVDLRAPRPDPELQALEQKRRGVVEQVRGLVRDTVPKGAKVAVVTHGDDELLKLAGRTGRHLPQAEGGVYAGYHPADSVTAIAQLEALREEGVDVLVIPAPQLWWLDHYAEFARHLAERYRLVARRAEAGVVYDVSGRRRFLPWRRRTR